MGELDGRTLNAKLDEKSNVGGSRRNSLQITRFSGLSSRGGSSRFAGGGCNVVYIGNLPWSIKWQDLKDLCLTYGDVTRADVQMDEEGKSKGFGIVRFSNDMAAQDCVMDLNGRELDGRVLNVREDRHYGVPYMKGQVKIYVGNLPYSTTWQELKDMCKEFAGAGSATSCIANLNGQILDGRSLVVKFDRFNN